ncbi:Epidermal growth factor receptor kinase substrate 8-like protein 1 [Fragariocoptes setiger]|uniref:Epidermal growth factor receptor kinase substrate 8-like protein 1 n=1 Tax=Fragariocoptes setiger TaxID=1670756 RepID=A0ABQ7S6V6_9ACAR|nr:Epidermal growth factor receptor kinase substrate 8-like protein 1 [Fragariocoptes setiger]
MDQNKAVSDGSSPGTIYDVEHLATFSSNISVAGTSANNSTSAQQSKPTASSSASSSTSSSGPSNNGPDNRSDDTDDTTTPKLALHRLFELEKTSGIWTQRMQIELQSKHLLIVDCETQNIVESFSKANVCKPTAFSDQDHIYNNIIIFEIKSSDTSSNQDNTADDNLSDNYGVAKQHKGELHIFQCVSHQAQQVVNDILEWKSSIGDTQTQASNIQANSMKSISINTTNKDLQQQSQSDRRNISSSDTSPAKPVLISSASAGKDMPVVNVSVKDTVNVFNQIAAQREKATVSVAATKPTSPAANKTTSTSVAARLLTSSASSSSASTSSSSSSSLTQQQQQPPLPPPVPQNGRTTNDQPISHLAKGPRAILDGSQTGVTPHSNQIANTSSSHINDHDVMVGHSSSSRHPSIAVFSRSGHHHHHYHNHQHHQHQSGHQHASNTSQQHQHQHHKRRLDDSQHKLRTQHRSVSPPALSGAQSIDQVTTNEAYVSVLNHCFDDIEKFILRLQNALHAQREIRANGNKASSEGLLATRARGPSENDYFEILAKFKLAFNLLAKLKSCIHEPNAPELVHFIFTPLAIIIEAARNARPVAVDPTMVGVPYLCQDAIDLLSNCCTSKESDIWHSLGPNWTQTVQPHLLIASRLPNSFQPIFGDGWGPVITDLELVGLVMPPHAMATDDPVIYDPTLVDRGAGDFSDASSDMSNPMMINSSMPAPPLLPPPPTNLKTRAPLPPRGQSTVGMPYASNQKQSQLQSHSHSHDHHQRQHQHQRFSHSSSGGREYFRPPIMGQASRVVPNRHSTGSQMVQNRGYKAREYHPAASGSPPVLSSPADSSMADESMHVRSKSVTMFDSAHGEFDEQQSAWLAELLARNAKIVKVIYPRTADNDKELTVYRGEILEILDDSRRWWKARNCHNEVAYVPHTLVAELDFGNDDHNVRMMSHNMSHLNTAESTWEHDGNGALNKNHPANWSREKAGAFRYF